MRPPPAQLFSVVREGAVLRYASFSSFDSLGTAMLMLFRVAVRVRPSSLLRDDEMR